MTAWLAVFTSCRSCGIGRRAWFRSMYSQGCGGSSPFFGTIPRFFGLFRHLDYGGSDFPLPGPLRDRTWNSGETEAGSLPGTFRLDVYVLYGNIFMYG